MIFFATVFLLFSGLSIRKAIVLQVDVIDVFWRSLIEVDVVEALMRTIEFLTREVVVPLLAFLALATAGFLSLWFVKERMSRVAFWISLVAFVVLAIFLSNFNTFILIVGIGMIVTSFYTLHMFEVRKTLSSTTRALTSGALKVVNCFLALALFLTLYLRLPVYESLLLETNLEMVWTFLPVEQVGTVISGFAVQSAEALKESITQQYQQVPSPFREQCEPVYNAVILGIEEYAQQVQVANVTTQVEEIVKGLPFMNQLVKVSPLVLAIPLFGLVEILKLPISWSCGLISFGLQQFKPKKSGLLVK
jgi:hypothetical protein